MRAWSEEKEDVRIRIAFTGQDGDARDAAEIERFRSELSTPAASDTTPDGALARYRGSSAGAQLGTLGVLSLMFGGFLLFVAVISSSIGLALFSSPFLGWVLLKTVRSVRFSKPVSREHFSIVFEPAFFASNRMERRPNILSTVLPNSKAGPGSSSSRRTARARR